MFVLRGAAPPYCPGWFMVTVGVNVGVAKELLLLVDVAKEGVRIAGDVKAVAIDKEVEFEVAIVVEGMQVVVGADAGDCASVAAVAKGRKVALVSRERIVAICVEIGVMGRSRSREKSRFTGLGADGPRVEVEGSTDG